MTIATVRTTDSRLTPFNDQQVTVGAASSPGDKHHGTNETGSVDSRTKKLVTHPAFGSVAILASDLR
jgi:hypothetical protein